MVDVVMWMASTAGAKTMTAEDRTAAARGTHRAPTGCGPASDQPAATASSCQPPGILRPRAPGPSHAPPGPVDWVLVRGRVAVSLMVVSRLVWHPRNRAGIPLFRPGVIERLPKLGPAGIRRFDADGVSS